MLANEVFITLTEILDPSKHRAFNEWHQLDHRPENLALPGVLHGERWVRTPDCAAASAPGSPLLAGCHYANIYWFADPVEESIKEWQQLAERSFQWGRRPDGPYVRRPLMGFFTTVKGYAAPRVLVSPDALPFRPNLGVIVVVQRMLDPHSAESEEMLAWYDRVHVPAVLSVPGVRLDVLVEDQHPRSRVVGHTRRHHVHALGRLGRASSGDGLLRRRRPPRGHRPAGRTATGMAGGRTDPGQLGGGRDPLRRSPPDHRPVAVGLVRHWGARHWGARHWGRAGRPGLSPSPAGSLRRWWTRAPPDHAGRRRSRCGSTSSGPG